MTSALTLLILALQLLTLAQKAPLDAQKRSEAIALATYAIQVSERQLNENKPSPVIEANIVQYAAISDNRLTLRTNFGIDIHNIEILSHDETLEATTTTSIAPNMETIKTVKHDDGNYEYTIEFYPSISAASAQMVNPHHLYLSLQPSTGARMISEAFYRNTTGTQQINF